MYTLQKGKIPARTKAYLLELQETQFSPVLKHLERHSNRPSQYSDHNQGITCALRK